MQEQLLFLIPFQLLELLLFWSFFSSFTPDSKPASTLANINWALYIQKLILLYFTAVLNYLIVFYYNIT